MSFLLPQTKAGTVVAVRPLDIHGDRYVDIRLDLDDAPGQPIDARVSASECPPGLAASDRIEARFTMGVIVRISRLG